MASSRRYRKHQSSVSAAPRAGTIHPVAGRYYQVLRHLGVEHKRAVLRALQRRLDGQTELSETQELVAWWWTAFRTRYGREPSATLWDKKRREDAAFAAAPSSMTVRTAFTTWAGAHARLGAGDPVPDPVIREKLATGPFFEAGELRVVLDAFRRSCTERRAPERDEFLEWLEALAPEDLPAGVSRVPRTFAPFEAKLHGWRGCLKAMGWGVERRHASGPRHKNAKPAGGFTDDQLLSIVVIFARWQAGPLSYRDFQHWLKHPSAPLGVRLPPRIPRDYDIYRTRFGSLERVLCRAGLGHRVARYTASRGVDWDPAEVSWLPENTPSEWPTWKRDQYWIDAASSVRGQRITRREYLRLRRRWADLADERRCPPPDAPHGSIIAERQGGWAPASKDSWERVRGDTRRS